MSNSPLSLSTLTKLICPLQYSLYESIGTSLSAPSGGTLKRVAAITYSEFSVVNGEQWLPPVFGISMISSVRKVSRLIRAKRGVLLELANIHLPSGMPSVKEDSMWCRSSHGTKPCEVCSIGLVSSLHPQPFSGSTEKTGMTRNKRPLGKPYTLICPLNPPETKLYNSSYCPGGIYVLCDASPVTALLAPLCLHA